MKKLTYCSIATLLSCILFLNSSILAQEEQCGFDESLEYAQNEIPDFDFLMKQGEKLMQQMLEDEPQPLMENIVFTIPVVFHIIHTGESVGTGSNLSDARILQALNDLNSDFRDFPMLGVDTEIEYCLAQRDPDGNSQYDSNGTNITGIQRVNGTGTQNYEIDGITRFQNGNEVAVKALSNWPNTDYLNIWVVHTIQGNAIGYATFPVADDAVDGIVLEAIATGTNDFSRVIAHEAGHFLNLYHTFQGSASPSECPQNIDCAVDGDKVCDTRPHSYMSNPGNWFPCQDSQYQNCDASSYPYHISENHMNYTDNDCRNEFSPDQNTRMRCALMALRPTLINSLGCQPGCSGILVDFSASDISVEEGGSITFTNSSSGATDYKWTIEADHANSTHLTYTFDERGFYDVCLTASSASCSNRKCMQVIVYGGEPCFSEPSECTPLRNGNFLETNFQLEDGFYAHILNGGLNDVCNWDNYIGSPDLIHNNSTSAIRLISDIGDIQNWNSIKYNKEALKTIDELNLKPNRNYTLSLDYFVSTMGTCGPNGVLEIGFTDGFGNNQFLTEVYPEFIFNTPNNQIGTFDLNNNPISTFVYHFNSNNVEDGKLYLWNKSQCPQQGNLHWVNYLITNINLVCNDVCTPIPDFTYDQTCPNTFIAQNSGDGNIYQWEFKCDGLIMNGQEVTRDFPAGTECEVCLTAACDLENEATFCEMVTIPEDLPSECTDDCRDISVKASTCEQADGVVNEYLTNFTITVPKNSGPCGDEPLQSNSTTVGVILESYKEQPSADPDFVDITIGMLITVPPTLDLTQKSVAAGLTLCAPDGTLMCFNLTISGEECSSACLDLGLNSNAFCVDPNPANSIFLFTGSVTFELDTTFSQYDLCNITSSQVGLEINFTDNNGEITIDYTIESVDFDFEISTLICIVGINGVVKFCTPLNINVPVPCLPVPETCIQEWMKKNADTECEVENGQIKYNSSMDPVILLSPNFQLCEDEVWAIVEGGGSTFINEIELNGNVLKFNIDIYLPCDSVVNNTIYDLKILLCDEFGDLICLRFPLEFRPCEANCNKPKNRQETSQNEISCSVYPNPFTDYLIIDIGEKVNSNQFGKDGAKHTKLDLSSVLDNKLDQLPNNLDNSQYIARLFNVITGQKVLNIMLNKGVNMINLEIPTGVYIVRIEQLTNPESVYSYKIVKYKF